MVKLFRPRTGADWSAHSSVQHPCGKLLPWRDCPQIPMSQDYQHLFSTSPEGSHTQSGKPFPKAKAASLYSPSPFSYFPGPPDLNPIGYTMRKQAFILGFVQEPSSKGNLSFNIFLSLNPRTAVSPPGDKVEASLPEPCSSHI